MNGRPPRAQAAFALALFLAGTHYCMVGVVASAFGARISCMAPAMAESGSCHAAPAASHCAQAASAEGRAAAPAGRTAEPPAGTPPCCVALAPVLSAPGIKLPLDALASALPAPLSFEVVAPAPASWHGYRVTCDAGPPALHLRAPLSPRAPPLA